MVEQALISLLFLLTGYFIGRGTTYTQVKEKVTNVLPKREPIITGVGPVEAPTQERLDEIDNPKVNAGIKEFGKLIREKILKHG